MNLGKKLSRDGVIVQQSSSPVLVKEAFLCIGRTMEAGGLSVVPYHDNVPSFGEWGWWIGGHGDTWSKERVNEALGSIDTLRVLTEYLTGPAIARTLVFGKNMLDARDDEINTLLNSTVFTFYRMGMRERG
jgi:spermidine synthase